MNQFLRRMNGKQRGRVPCGWLVFTLLVMFLPGTEAMAQQRVVTGSVTSADNGTSLPLVNVLVKGTQNGSHADENGKFEIRAAPGEMLVFSFVGYKTVEKLLGNESVLQVVLEPEAGNLNEVVVIGYGVQSRETLTFAISRMDKKVIENTVFGDASAALQGTVSGVRVQQTSGQPGASPRVIVRGGASINNPNGAQPLYIVDGVIRPDLEGINTADIESMQVLKDAAATAIYGARASNGVVIVALKKGAAGRSVVSYQYSIGFSGLREKYDVLSARDYVYYARLGAAAAGRKLPDRLLLLTQANSFGTGNDLGNKTIFTTQYLTDANRYKLSEGWESIQDPIDPSKTLIFAGTDWQDVLFRTGVTNDHYLNFSGGNEKATFNLGVGYTTIDGIAIRTNYRRFSANLNGKVNLSDKLYAFGSLNFSRFGDNVVFSENNLFERALSLPPTTKYQFEDGTLSPGITRTLGNPAYHLDRSTTRNQDNVMTLSGGLNWEIAPDLTFEPTVSLFYKASENNNFQKSYFDSPTQFVDTRAASGSYTKWDQQQYDATLSYQKTYQDRHRFQAKAGISYFVRENRSLNAAGRGAATDLIPTLNASAIPVSVSSTGSEQAILGFFGRITYDYDRRYLMTINLRQDGASNLGEDNRWGFFPGISAGWNVHNEKFWKRRDLTRLKLRASYGVNGNLGNLADFQAQGQYSVGATYDGNAAVEYTTLANQSLRWEQSRTFDLGIDAGFFDDRITLVADYYRRVTDNLITSLALPYNTGFSSILTNLGSLQNKGVELELGGAVIRNEALNWEVSLNASYNTNRILKLPPNTNENNRVGGLLIYDPAIGDYAWRGGLQEGGRIGELYGYKFEKVYATDEEAAAGPVDQIMPGTNKAKYGGDVSWLDVDGNNVIDTRDRVYMGNIYPKWTGGFTNTLNYRGIGLFVRMDYTTGHTIYNYVRANMNGHFVTFGLNGTSDILRSWLNQGDVTDVPRYYYNDISAQSNYWRNDPRNVNNGNGSSQNYERGDYLALREVTLSYAFPAGIYRKAGLKGLRINLTGNNLKYFTKYTGLAPEEGGIDSGRYPVPRVLTFGLKASI